MFIAILQLRHALTEHGHLYLFIFYVALTWLVWLAKIVLANRYRPWKTPVEVTTSVIIPVVDEPLDLFRDVLRRIVEQRPTETIVIINGPRNTELEAVCEEFPTVVWTWTPVAGKRNAVRVGVERCVGEIVLLVDSDTIWTTGTLHELMKPFADRRIGGVTTRQRILEPERSFYTRWADWLENTRAQYSMPAQSVLGSVGCLPGRTIAFRRSILVDVMDDFMSARFLGVFLEVSDDRTLTNLTLRKGFRTVYQSTSLVYTDAPLQLRKLLKQQLRWSRGSQYNTLRMLPWMLRHTPMLAFFFVSDIVMPLLLFTILIAWVIRTANHSDVNLYAGLLDVEGRAWMIPAIVTITVLVSAISMTMRQLRHIEERPVDLFWMPVYVLFSTLFLMPIRAFGFIRLGHVGGWGTRAAAYSADQADTPSPTLTALSTLPRTASATTASRTATQLPALVSGDPRALVPYLLVSALVPLGVLYDIHVH
ncbi:glycosyltransferase family 2 protein [Lapillicoccus sp.]|uniref:glycosyltransferase family 2 protein n=1 Tax=Lapillicoccus sp. TaxID=1909287 RepID=UPI0025D71205|nr:glycosyltransferase family 2 protein [Lapillicoccus sp.]